MTGWDSPKTAYYYEEFCNRHDRYEEASRSLVGKAELVEGLRVLDLGAGTGRTSEMILPFLGKAGSILCIEPAGAMRSQGELRLHDSRVAWRDAFPEPFERFDRIVSSAAIWQMLPLCETFRSLRSLLEPQGILCFNIPSLYLGEPDEPGGGEDPLLTTLMTNLAKDRISQAPPQEPLPTAERIERLLLDSGFITERWTMRTRLTQQAYRDWLKIPVITDWLLGDLDPDDRASLINDAYKTVDPCSWRWENWTGWSARLEKTEM